MAGNVLQTDARRVMIDVSDVLDRIFAQRWMNLGLDCSEDGTFQAAFTLSSMDPNRRYAPTIESPADRRSNLYAVCETFDVSANLIRQLDNAGIRSITLLSLMSKINQKRISLSHSNSVGLKNEPLESLRGSTEPDIDYFAQSLWEKIFNLSGCSITDSDKKNLLECMRRLNETPLEPLYSLKRLISHRASKQHKMKYGCTKKTEKFPEHLSYLDLASLDILINRKDALRFNEAFLFGSNERQRFKPNMYKPGKPRSVSTTSSDSYDCNSIGTLSLCSSYFSEHNSSSNGDRSEDLELGLMNFQTYLIAQATFKETSGNAFGRQKGSRDFLYQDRELPRKDQTSVPSTTCNLLLDSPVKSPQKKIRKITEDMAYDNMNNNVSSTSTYPTLEPMNERFANGALTKEDKEFVENTSKLMMVDHYENSLPYTSNLLEGNEIAISNSMKSTNGNFFNTPIKPIKIDSPIQSPSTTHRVVLVPYPDTNSQSPSMLSLQHEKPIPCQDLKSQLSPAMLPMHSANIMYRSLSNYSSPSFHTASAINVISPISNTEQGLYFEMDTNQPSYVVTENTRTRSSIAKNLFPDTQMTPAFRNSNGILSNSIQNRATFRSRTTSLTNAVDNRKIEIDWSRSKDESNFELPLVSDAQMFSFSSHYQNETLPGIKQAVRSYPSTSEGVDENQYRAPKAPSNGNNMKTQIERFTVLSRWDNPKLSPKPVLGNQYGVKDRRVHVNQTDTYKRKSSNRNYIHAKDNKESYGNSFKSWNMPTANEIHDKDHNFVAQCPYLFCTKNSHTSTLDIGGSLDLHLKTNHPEIHAGNMRVTMLDDNLRNRENFSYPTGCLTYGTEEREYIRIYSLEGLIETQIQAEKLLQPEKNNWWWGPWSFSFDGIVFYLMLYRDERNLYKLNSHISKYHRGNYQEVRTCFLIRANCTKEKASQYSYRVQIFDPKDIKSAVSGVNGYRFFVGEVQSLQEIYNEQCRRRRIKSVEVQKQEFFNTVSSKGHIVHYRQSILENRVWRDGYIKYKISIYRMEDSKDMPTQVRNA